jgi:hypothetical protein
MSLTKEGVNGYGEQHWRLRVPPEYCVPGLEVGIVATLDGLHIGDELITWTKLEQAKQRVIERAAYV